MSRKLTATQNLNALLLCTCTNLAFGKEHTSYYAVNFETKATKSRFYVAGKFCLRKTLSRNLRQESKKYVLVPAQLWAFSEIVRGKERTDAFDV